MKMHFIDKDAQITACGNVSLFFHMYRSPVIITRIPSETTCKVCIRTKVFKKAKEHEDHDRNNS